MNDASLDVSKCMGLIRRLSGGVTAIQFQKFHSATGWNHPRQNVLVTRPQVETLHKQQTSPVLNNTQSNLHFAKQLWGTASTSNIDKALTFRIEDLAQDSGHILVRAECGYSKGSPNTNS
jgi:hypothetical protein